MPELPEVTNIVKQLASKLRGASIEIIKQSQYEMGNVLTSELASFLKENYIKNILQRGKYIVFVFGKNKDRASFDPCQDAFYQKESDYLKIKKEDGSIKLQDNEAWLIFHLRMSGKLVLQEFTAEKKLNLPLIESKAPIHTHLIFSIVKKGEQKFLNPMPILYYADTRRFGRFSLIKSSEEAEKYFSKLGIEILSEKLNVAYLEEKIKKHPKLSLKAFLLRQDILAGIGNIYADEICFLLKEHPSQVLESLPHSKISLLPEIIISLIREAISSGGTTFRDYVDSNNKKGSFQNKLQVYGRFSKPCFSCGTTLEKVKEAGRTGSFCPKCQELHKPNY